MTHIDKFYNKAEIVPFIFLLENPLVIKRLTLFEKLVKSLSEQLSL